MAKDERSTTLSLSNKWLVLVALLVVVLIVPWEVSWLPLAGDGGAGGANWWCWLVNWRVLLVVCLLLDVLAVPLAGRAAAATLEHGSDRWS